MLELRPSCEHCATPLPNGSPEAMICSFECTFCRECVDTILQNVCPNCGGGFEKRPTRPTMCDTGNCIETYPASGTHKHKPVDLQRFAPLRDKMKALAPGER